MVNFELELAENQDFSDEMTIDLYDLKNAEKLKKHNIIIKIQIIQI